MNVFETKPLRDNTHGYDEFTLAQKNVRKTITAAMVKTKSTV